MIVEIPADVREMAPQLGAGAPYALKVVAGQLADDPDMGEPSAVPGILTVMVDGDLFEDCPDLIVGYIHEPDRIEIRYVNRAVAAEPVQAARDQEGMEGQQTDAAADVVTHREVTDAWGRITGWLQRNAPASYAALRDGVSAAAVTELERELGTRIPVELRALWLLTAGDDGVNGWGWGCLPRSESLMSLDAVASVYRFQMGSQVQEDVLNADRVEDERIILWKPTWIPVVAHGAADSTSGLFLDAATGYLGRWNRYSAGFGEQRDTLVTYLEEAADMLESPALATRDKPGLIGDALVWRSRLDAAQKDRWRPLSS
ncbi:hypothetical protein ACQEV9_45695 [Streptomyces chartreusis]|uniref:hypothetical protein n=1 Tax=Streptomyces chartreusis TaxID=1969 RepID=UPI003D8A29D4